MSKNKNILRIIYDFLQQEKHVRSSLITQEKFQRFYQFLMLRNNRFKFLEKRIKWQQKQKEKS